MKRCHLQGTKKELQKGAPRLSAWLPPGSYVTKTNLSSRQVALHKEAGGNPIKVMSVMSARSEQHHFSNFPT
eukprot:scaffold96538_cov21-Tisochrysis_lutea.AAC.1